MVLGKKPRSFRGMVEYEPRRLYSQDEIAEFIKSLDENISWHVTRFYPTYNLTDLPPTPVDSLNKARKSD